MFGILYIFFIAIINNIDSISVRIAYSLKGIKVGIYKNILISIVTFIITTLIAISGNTLSGVISAKICNIVTMIVFVVLGLYFIIEPHIKREDKNTFTGIITNPNNADIDNSKTIDFKEALFLSIALNINNIGGSFSGGILGLNAYLIGGLSAVISFLTLWLGNYLVNIIKDTYCKRANFIAGLILIILGIKQLL